METVWKWLYDKKIESMSKYQESFIVKTNRMSVDTRFQILVKFQENTTMAQRLGV